MTVSPRQFALALVVSLMAVAGGCHPAPRPVLVETATQPALRSPLPTPPLVDPASVTARTGSALAHAQFSLEQAVATLEEPEFITAARRQIAAPASQPAEPPIEAQRDYFAGRTAWRSGDLPAAARALERALAADPDRPQILRLLGQVLAVSNDRARAEDALARAVAADPQDPTSLLLLARFAIDDRKWDRAGSILAFAAGVAPPSGDDDAGRDVVMRQYLAVALDHLGFDAAAAQQFDLVLADDGREAFTSRFGGELAQLDRQRATLYQIAGDEQMRLGEPAQALEHYQLAVAEDPEENRPELAARIVYTTLVMNRPDAAIAVTAAQIRLARADPASLRLVEYLDSAGVDRARLAAALTPLYTELDRPASLAVATAALRDPAAARRLLLDHMKSRPADLSVFETLLRSYEQPVGPPDAAGATSATLTVIEREPRLAQRYASSLLSRVQPAAVIAAMGPSTPTAAPASHYLRGVALAAVRRLADADRELRLAEPSLDAARIAHARIQVQRGDYTGAEATLTPLANADAPSADVVSLQVEILRHADRSADALRLLDDAIERSRRVSADTDDLIVTKSLMQMIDGDFTGANRTITAAIDASPRSAKLYEHAFGLYNTNALADKDRLRLRLLRQAVTNIPTAHVTRFNLAQEDIRQRDVASAEQVLRGMLAENPGDGDALELLLLVLDGTDRRAAADELITNRLAAMPRDRDVLAAALRYYAGTHQRDRLAQVSEQVIALDPPGPDHDRRLATLYLQTQRDQQAIDLLTAITQSREPDDDPSATFGLLWRAFARLKQTDRIDELFPRAIERYPDDAADLYFEWAMSFERRDLPDRSEEMLTRAIEKDPHHAHANNALGYAWAERGQRLDDAIKMIQLALSQDRTSAAYLDSLGWAYYKQGRFDLALDALTRATMGEGGQHPVILEHLGDALYRVGKHVEALETWDKAQHAADPEDDADDPEVKASMARLKEKLDAAQAGQPPKTAWSIKDRAAPR